MPKRNTIVVGASAGGVEALTGLIKKLPKHLDATVFVVMHVGAESILPEILTRCGTLPVMHAEHNGRYKRGCIYVAPSDYHLIIKGSMTVLSRGPRENGHRPAVDTLFRSAAREHRNRVAGVVLSGGLDDGTAGLFAIKSRGGVAIVQDPAEAVSPSMPKSALDHVDVDYCLPISQIATVLVELARGHATSTTEAPNGGANMSKQMTSKDSPTKRPETHIPLSCPECNGPLYEVKKGHLAHFHCFLGHAFSPESLSDQHADALERALWVAMRTLSEGIMLHRKLLEHRRNRGEEELMKRMEESIATAEKDTELLREILDRI